MARLVPAFIAEVLVCELHRCFDELGFTTPQAAPPFPCIHSLGEKGAEIGSW
jgi:hypothetical protein